MNKKPVYVIGHKNPDTDSIVSAIGYAEFKKKQGIDAVAGRVGSISSETEYLLDRFGFDDPLRIYSAKSTLSEIEMDKATVVSKNMTMKDALDKALKLKNRGLIVGDKTKHLEGVVSLDDLTYMWTKSDEELEEIIKTIRLEDIVKILEGEVVIAGNHSLSGKMHIFPSTKSRVGIDSIVLLRNNDDEIIYSLDKGAKLFIIVTSSPISKKVIDKAKKEDATIITTTMSPLSVTRLIYQTPTIGQVMMPKDKIEYFNDDETVDEVSKKIAKSRHRSYPVLDENGRVVGAISRYHLFNYTKKQFILVDHNEIKQTVEDIEEGEVLEIVDHHRIGGFESDNPISIITMPVGACSTIVANLFVKANMAISKKLAGILLGAIISDTMNFKSPTTTPLDLEMAKKLEEISGVNSDELSKSMIEHSESLLNKRMIEIVFTDFKEFNIDGNKVGLSQATCRSKEEYTALKDQLKKYLEDSCKSQHYDVMIAMLTNPNGSGSYIISAGNKENITNEIYGKQIKDGFVSGLVSRKKQLLPSIIHNFGGK